MTYNEEDLASNPARRVPVCLCLDGSASMHGGPARELSLALNRFIGDVKEDDAARYSFELCTVVFDGRGARCIQSYDIAEHQSYPELSAYGGSPLGEGVMLALDLLEERKEAYRRSGTDYYQPMLLVISDGLSDGDQEILDEAGERVAEMAKARKLSVFAVAVGRRPDLGQLRKISAGREPLKLEGLNFRGLFEWLGRSLDRVSQSRPGEDIELERPGWAQMDGDE